MPPFLQHVLAGDGRLLVIVAAIFGVLLGAPTLRLRGDYLAIVTLGFGEIVPNFFLNAEPSPAVPRGINPIAKPTDPSWRPNLASARPTSATGTG